MRNACVAVVGVCALIGAASAGISTTTINFDNLANGTVVSDQYRGLGVVFEGNWVVNGPGASTNAVSSPNSVAYFNQESIGENYTVAVNFVVPGTSTQAGTRYVSFTPTDASNTDTLCTIRAYNAAGFEVANNNRLSGAEGTYDPLVDTALDVSVPPDASPIVRVELTVALSVPGSRVIEGDDFVFGEIVVAPCGLADVGSTGGAVGPDRVLDNNDFVVFVDMFFEQDARGDIGSTGGEPGSDGVFDNNDYVVFVDEFFLGCGT